MNRLTRSMCAFVFYGLMALSSASGQDSIPDQNTDDDPAIQKTVVVTALKRDQDLQDVPAAISAFDADALENAGIDDALGLQKLVPSITVGEHFGSTMVNIRGVGSNVSSGATEPSVAIYVDGILLPRQDMAYARPVDMERVEILRGPQGTLYGRNATGGAINFISKTPTDTFEAGVNLSVGERNGRGASGYMSGPIADGLSVRVSGGFEEQDGYVKELNLGQRLNGIDTQYGRIALRAKPSEDLTIDLSVRYEENTSPHAIQLFTDSPFGTGFTTNENRVLLSSPNKTDNETTVVNATVNWDISDQWSFKSITGFINHDGSVSIDADATAVDFYYTDDFQRPSEVFSQELNLVGSFESLDLLLGAYYFQENARITLPVAAGVAGAPAFGLPVGAGFDLGVNPDIQSYAIYGEATWHVSDRLRLVGGLRLNKDDNTFDQTYSVFPDIVPLTVVPIELEDEAVLPKLAVQYDFSDNVSGYAQWTKGYKSGGVNLTGAGGVFFGAFEPEELSAFEVGLKSQLFDRRLTANLAAFLYDYKDLQFSDTIPPSATVVRNTDAEIMGLEAEFQYLATDNISLFFSPTYLNAENKDLMLFNSATGNLLDLDGEPMIRSPEFAFTAGANFDFPLNSQWFSGIEIQPTVSYKGEHILRQQNEFPEIESQDAYTIVDLSATLTSRDEKTWLTAFVNNVTDELYKNHVIYYGIGYIGSYSAPSTWGLRLSHEF